MANSVWMLALSPRDSQRLWGTKFYHASTLVKLATLVTDDLIKYDRNIIKDLVVDADLHKDVKVVCSDK